MTYSSTLREEELKLKVAKNFFSGFDTTPIIGNIDFCVAVADEKGTLFNQKAQDAANAKTAAERKDAEQSLESILWAEAKKGVKTESGMYESLVQLILTIGKARTFDLFLPPPISAHSTRKKSRSFRMKKLCRCSPKTTSTGK